MARNTLQIEGKRFNQLLVLSFAGINQNSHSMWLCRCDCGNEKIILGCHLTRDKIKSCGCYQRDFKKLAKGKSAMNSIYCQYKCRSRRFKRDFNLTKDEFNEIIVKDCFYCGDSPSNIAIRGTNGDFKYNGVDRIDSTKGYIKGNVIPCCAICNQAKMALDIDLFYNKVKKIYEHLNLKDKDC